MSLGTSGATKWEIVGPEKKGAVGVRVLDGDRVVYELAGDSRSSNDHGVLGSKEPASS